jgi:uncharacterized membrane protein YphA (DoxX/SURF4 family)
MKNLKMILRLLIGVVFIASAVLKLFSIDQFEIYIYTFDIFNFFITSLLSRLLITFEFLLGVFLICKFFYQKTWWLTMLTMIGFTLFLIYTALFRNDANCHCFGSFIEVDPVGSIFKNIAIIVLLLFVKKQEDWNFKYKKWMIAGFLILGLISTFVFFPPDALYNKIYKPKSKVNPVVFEYIVKDSAKVGLSEIQGKHILAFYISGCKFCKMSMQKVDNIFKRNGIAEEKFVAIIAGGPKQVESFKKETQSEKYNMYAHKSAVQFLNAVYGSFPTIIYMNGDSIVKVINYRGIDEAEMVKFLKE